MRKILVFILLCCILCGTALADSKDNISSIDCGNGLIFVIMDDGKLIAWGDNSNGLIPADNNHKYIKYENRCLIMSSAKSVSVGENCVLAVNDSGELFGWGHDGDIGLLCGKADGDISKEPVKLMDNVVCASSGRAHNAAVTSDGELYTWGKDCHGSLGIGSVNGRSFPKPHKVMDSIESVHCFGNCTLAITKDGRLYAWGEEFGFNKPQQITSSVVDVAEACNKTFLIQNTANQVQLLQCNTMEDGTPSIKLTPPVVSNIVSITDYGYIRNDGTLWMCKSDSHNTFVPSAERVKMAQCCDMNYRAYVSLRTLHMDRTELNTFIKDESHSISDISLPITPTSSGVFVTIFFALLIAAITVIAIEKPAFYIRLIEEIKSHL